MDSFYVIAPDIDPGLTLPAYRQSRPRKLSAFRRILERITR